MLDQPDQPPPYNEKSFQPFVQASRSPPVEVRNPKLLCSHDLRIEVTPIGSPVSDSASPPTPDSVSYSILSGINMNIENIEGGFDKDMVNTHEEKDIVWDTDEERYARELSQLRQDVSVFEGLRSDFKSG